MSGRKAFKKAKTKAFLNVETFRIQSCTRQMLCVNSLNWNIRSKHILGLDFSIYI